MTVDLLTPSSAKPPKGSASACSPSAPNLCPDRGGAVGGPARSEDFVVAVLEDASQRGRVTFSTAPGTDGEVVFAQFDIGDAIFMSFTKMLARQTTKEILEYAQTECKPAGSSCRAGSRRRMPTGTLRTASC